MTAEKTSLRKWIRVLSIFIAITPTLSNVGEVSQSWIPKNHIQVQKERQFLRLLCTSIVHREIRHFHVVAVQWPQRNVQKSVITCKSVVFLIKHIAFEAFPLVSSDLKVPIDAIQTDIETMTPITHIQLILDLYIHQIPYWYLFTWEFKFVFLAIVKKIAKLKTRE